MYQFLEDISDRSRGLGWSRYEEHGKSWIPKQIYAKLVI